MSESSGWRDVREFNGLPRGVDYERSSDLDADEESFDLDVIGVEDVRDSEICSDGGVQVRSGYSFHRLNDNSDWALMWVSDNLEEFFENEDEFWVLRYGEDGLEPVLYAEEDEIIISPDYNPDLDTELSNGEMCVDMSPIDMIEETDYSDILFGRDYSVEEIGRVPNLDNAEFLKGVEDAFLHDGYVAPGLGQNYRENAEKSIRRSLTDN